MRDARDFYENPKAWNQQNKLTDGSTNHINDTISKSGGKISAKDCNGRHHKGNGNNPQCRNTEGQHF